MKAKEYLQKAREISGNTAKEYREWAEKVQAEISKANVDTDLSSQGREKKVAELKQKYGVELMQSAHRAKDQYQTWLKRAQREADKVANAKPKKPDAAKVERFSDGFKRLKTELMLATRPESAEQKLRDFVASIDEPYFANEVADQFAELVPHVTNIAGNDANRYRLKLAGMYEDLQRNHVSDDVKEAREVLEASNHALGNPKIFAPLVEENVSEMLGGEYGRQVNEPETFFESNADLKPEPYRDEIDEKAEAPEDPADARYRDMMQKASELERKLSEIYGGGDE
ncbi:MAG TPA: hypothetical protein VFK33_10845 [Bacillales bacterium]|nr:hypothetical protein [Bacillales bacterium]